MTLLHRPWIKNALHVYIYIYIYQNYYTLVSQLPCILYILQCKVCVHIKYTFFAFCFTHRRRVSNLPWTTNLLHIHHRDPQAQRFPTPFSSFVAMISNFSSCV